MAEEIEVIYPTVPMGMDETVVASDEEMVDRYTTDGVAELLTNRAMNRPKTRYDVVVVLKPWAVRDKYDIASAEMLLAGEVNDYSAKAIRVRGGFWIDETEVAEYKWINNVLTNVDDGENKEGTTYFPKKAVKTIVKPDYSVDK